MKYLAPLEIAADRLRAQLPDTLPVRVGIDPTRAQSKSLGQPEVWVLFQRDSVDDTAGRVSCLSYQIAVVYVAPGLLPDLERDGETITAINKALQGYEVPRPLRLAPFKRVGSMVPQAWGDSMTAYGMLFETSFVL